MQKEYIERSEQESILKKRYYELAGRRPDFYAGYMTAFHIIENDIPNAADVVEVVRCKDCDVPHNRWIGCPNLNGLIPPPDFHCAYGERKIDKEE